MNIIEELKNEVALYKMLHERVSEAAADLEIEYLKLKEENTKLKRKLKKYEKD